MRHPRPTFYRLFLATLLTTACHATDAAPDPEQLQIACQLGSPATAALDGVQVTSAGAAPGDLPYYEARSSATGSSVRTYHEPDLAQAAASKAACLMGMLDLLATGLPHLHGPVTWSPLVLTHDAHYIPPKRDGELRWTTAFASTTWQPANMAFLLAVMPHEETHLSQNMGGARMPRWFEEGHAEWAGLQVTEQVSGELALKERARYANAWRQLGVAHLDAWGGIHVKPEAIERQLSVEDRERRKKDPSFTPPGPYSFGPDDFAEDNSNELGRYGAALALFNDLEQRHGRTAVQSWVGAVLASQDAAQILPLAQRMLGEDLAPSLK